MSIARNRLTEFVAFALVLLVDVLLFNAVFVGAYATFRFVLNEPVVFDTYRALVLYTWILPPVVFFFAGMYHSWDEYAFSKGMDAILSGVLATISLLVGLVWYLREDLARIQQIEFSGALGDIEHRVWGFPTSIVISVAVLAPVILWAWRVLANAIERRTLGWSARTRKALVVGPMNPVDSNRLKNSHRPLYDLLGCLVRDPAQTTGLPHLGTPDQLERVLQNQSVDEIFLITPDFDREELLRIFTLCAEHKIRCRAVLGIYETLLSATQTRYQGTIPVYSFRTAGIVGWTYVIKMLMDVTFAAIGLLITGPFLILPACLAILIESKGNPVFSQTRVGLHGRRFKLYKLRTMVVDADQKGGPLTEDNDPRITRVGRFLRKTSIDELPQLWNVLRGDMSLVGPRAVVPYVSDQFQEWERISLMVRPGVTGLAQVSGRDEIGFREKSLLNLYYVRNHSFWLDLRILVDTVSVVLSMEGTGGTRGA